MNSQTPQSPKPLPFDVFRYSIQHKKQIFLLFCLIYTVISVFVVLAGYATFTSASYEHDLYEWGETMGKFASVTFCITMIPGILSRFNLKYKIVSAVIMLHRRQWGILTFLLALAHMSSLRLFLMLKGTLPWNTVAGGFELFGLIAFLFLFPLFLTSNDLSQKNLGIWWYRLHWAVYIIVWSIFLHVYYQDPYEIYSILVGLTGALEIISLIYKWYRVRQQTVISSPQNQSSGKTL